jgi:molybdopterin/thiamine biosynthesis adenylyltransferase
MKIYAMLGVATTPASLITVTDNDFIEKSNLNRYAQFQLWFLLNRQFLFRKEDLDQPKSETAAKAILSMNPDMRVKSYTTLVTKETEDTFSDDFFKQQVRYLSLFDSQS